MSIKYHLVPGEVKSRFDGDRHMISATQLAGLYQIRMGEWSPCRNPDDCRVSGVAHLFPKLSGNYVNPESYLRKELK